MAKIKLSRAQWLDIKAILPLLDGCDRVIGSGDTERVVREPFKFGGLTHLALAKLSNRVASLATTTDAARLAIYRSVAPEGVETLTSEKHPFLFKRFVAEYSKVLEQIEEIDVDVFTLDDLRLDVNSIPVSAALQPLMSAGIVTEEAGAEDAKPAKRKPAAKAAQEA